jgi:hypothetical protein
VALLVRLVPFAQVAPCHIGTPTNMVKTNIITPLCCRIFRPKNTGVSRPPLLQLFDSDSFFAEQIPLPRSAPRDRVSA